jgi:hypothetical protein
MRIAPPGQTSGRAGDRPRHQRAAEADPAPGTERDHPADRRLRILHAGIEHPGIGERLALHRRPRRQVPGRLVAAVDIEIDALLLDREDELPGGVDVLQLAHAVRSSKRHQRQARSRRAQCHRAA